MVAQPQELDEDAPPSQESLPGSCRAQVNAYRDAVDESPSSGHPPDSPSHEEKYTDYSTASLGILMQHLTLQLDNSCLV
jgi:hypothetical protein